MYLNSLMRFLSGLCCWWLEINSNVKQVENCILSAAYNSNLLSVVFHFELIGARMLLLLLALPVLCSLLQNARTRNEKFGFMLRARVGAFSLPLLLLSLFFRTHTSLSSSSSSMLFASSL